MSQAAPPPTPRQRAEGILRLLGWLWAALWRDLTDRRRALETTPLGLLLWAAGWVCASTVGLCWLHYAGAVGFVWWLWTAATGHAERRRRLDTRRKNHE